MLTRPPNSDLFKLETNSQHTIPVQLCASHVVSPRDLWLRVLPRWQLNVNVNESVNNTRSPEDPILSLEPRMRSSSP